MSTQVFCHNTNYYYYSMKFLKFKTLLIFAQGFMAHMSHALVNGKQWIYYIKMMLMFSSAGLPNHLLSIIINGK